MVHKLYGLIVEKVAAEYLRVAERRGIERGFALGRSVEAMSVREGHRVHVGEWLVRRGFEAWKSGQEETQRRDLML